MRGGALSIGALATYTRAHPLAARAQALPDPRRGGARGRRRPDPEPRHARRQRRQRARRPATPCPCSRPPTPSSCSRSARGTRRVPFDAFYTGYRKTVRRPDELIAAIEIPAVRGRQWFRKVGTRAAQAISKVVMAAVADAAARDRARQRRADRRAAPEDRGAPRRGRLDRRSARGLLDRGDPADRRPALDRRLPPPRRRRTCSNSSGGRRRDDAVLRRRALAADLRRGLREANGARRELPWRRRPPRSPSTRSTAARRSSSPTRHRSWEPSRCTPSTSSRRTLPPSPRRSGCPSAWLPWSWRASREKLAREPVEDFRIDFEDGYGNRPDAEEDGHAVSAAREVAAGSGGRNAAAFHRHPDQAVHRGAEAPAASARSTSSSPRSLDGPGRLPENFVVTLPKITSPEQVAALADLLDAAREGARIFRPGALRARDHGRDAAVDHRPNGRIAILPSRRRRGAGRCVAAHFGTYDYTASLNITAAHQHMAPPGLRLRAARHAGGAGRHGRLALRRSDERPAGPAAPRGEAKTLSGPPDPGEPRGRARRLEAPLRPRAALARERLLPGLGPAPRAAPDPLRGAATRSSWRASTPRRRGCATSSRRPARRRSSERSSTTRRPARACSTTSCAPGAAAPSPSRRPSRRAASPSRSCAAGRS